MRLDGASSVTKGPLMMLSTGRIEEKKGGKEERSRVRNIFRREQVPPKPSSFDTLLHLSPVATVAQVLPVAEKFALSPPRVVADNERVLQFCRFHLYLRHLLYRESFKFFFLFFFSFLHRVGQYRASRENVASFFQTSVLEGSYYRQF